MKTVRSFYAAFLGLILLPFVDPSGYLFSQWSNDPNVNTPVCLQTGGQLWPVATSDGSGGAIIAWNDQRNGNYDIYAQHLSSSGMKTWTAEGVPVFSAAGDQRVNAIVSDGLGGAIVAWVDKGSEWAYSRIYVQHLDASGNPVWPSGGVAVSPSPNPQDGAVMASDGAGGAIVAWTDSRNSDVSGLDIYAQRIAGDGTLTWGTGVAVCTAVNTQQDIQIIGDGSGGAIITWWDTFVTQRVYAQKLSSSGIPLWAQNGVTMGSSPATDHQSVPSICTDGVGGAFVAWEEARSGSDSYIYTQHVDGSGARLWGDEGIRVGAGSLGRGNAVITTDGSGGAIIAWIDERNDDGSDPPASSDIYAQRVDAAGDVQWSPDGVSICTEKLPQISPSIVSDHEGGAFIIWQDQRHDYSLNIYAQHVDPTGVVRWFNGIPVSTAGDPSEVERESRAIIDESGNTIVAWADGRNGNADIFAQKLFLGNGYNSYRTFSPEDIALAMDERGRVGRPVRPGKGMPNAINALQEAFRQGIYPGNPVGDELGGLVVGSSYLTERNGKVVVDPDSCRKYGWVRLGKWDGKTNLGKNYQNVLKTLMKRGIMHSSPAVGFSFKRERNMLPPTVQNNKLIAEQIALKLNILMSGIAITKPGFGELRYVESGSQYDGMFVRDIAARADRALGTPAAGWDYSSLLTIVERLNRSFEGSMDTIRPGYPFSLAIKGVTPPSKISYLRYEPNVPPRVSPRLFTRGEEGLPSRFALSQNFPNPFNPVTMISFELATDAIVTLKVYNTLGQEIATLAEEEEFGEGTSTLDFDGSNLPSGVYFYRIATRPIEEEQSPTAKAGFSQVMKMILLK